MNSVPIKWIYSATGLLLLASLITVVVANYNSGSAKLEKGLSVVEQSKADVAEKMYERFNNTLFNGEQVYEFLKLGEFKDQRVNMHFRIKSKDSNVEFDSSFDGHTDVPRFDWVNFKDVQGSAGTYVELLKSKGTPYYFSPQQVFISRVIKDEGRIISVVFDSR